MASFELKTNRLIKHLTDLTDNDYNPLTVKKEVIEDMTDWLMYVAQTNIERIKRETLR